MGDSGYEVSICASPKETAFRGCAQLTAAPSLEREEAGVKHLSGESTTIAVIGMAGRFPAARSVEELWRKLRAGEECLRRFGDGELRAAGVPDRLLDDPDYVRVQGFLEDIDLFDAGFFGLSPRDAAIFDPQHRFLLEVAWEAFEDAGYVPDAVPGAVGVFAAAGANDYFIENVLKKPDLVASVGEWLLRHTGNDANFLATRVSYQLNLKGPSISVQTACSSSLVAIHLACQSLLSGECDVALAGGSAVNPRQPAGYLYGEGEIYAPDGHCRPFDARAKGTVASSATGAVILKRLEDAVRDGDTIRALILGSAINNDGAEKVGFLAPSVEGQARVVAEALSIAGVAPDDISFIEGHGTGTLLGDPVELAALQQVFGEAGSRGHSCVIGSIKSNIGHAGEAASMAGFIKAVLALQHREIPPTVHFESPNPRAALEGRPFYASGKLLPWPGNGKPRRAGITGLGAGGTNAHVVIEEAPPAEALVAGGRPEQLLVVSARSRSAVDQACAQLAARLEADPGVRLADVALTLQQGRKAFAHRRGVVARDAATAAARLRDPALGFYGDATEARTVAFLFSGGGAQYPGMARGLCLREPAYRAAMDECLAAAPVSLGLRAALFPPDGDPAHDERQLEAPSLGLPALFATELSLARLLGSLGISPSAVLGHSAGEYAAACLAGVFSVADAMKLVALRGELFETLPEGGMLSVPLPEAELAALLPAGLSISVVNGPSLCVVSGPVPALAAFEQQLRAREIEPTRVHINVAAHSAMVDPILPKFDAACRGIRFRPPQLPYISNVTGTWARADDVTSPAYWVRHLREPVRFADGLRALREQKSLLLEVGPGRTLTSLARQQGAEAESTLRHPKENVDDVETLLFALGRIWARGVPLDWEKIRGAPGRRIPLPTYPFERQRHWVVPEAKVATALEGKRKDVGDWFAAPAWHPSAWPKGAAVGSAAPALVLDAGGALGRAVCAALGQGPVVRVFSGARFERSGADYRLRLGHRGDFEQLFGDLRSRGCEPGRVFHLAAAGKAKRDDRAAFAEATDLYAGLVFLAQQLAGQTTPVGLVIATCGAVAVGGEAVRSPERALLLGPALVLPRELPNVRVSAIDVDAGGDRASMAELAARLVRESSTGDVVASRGGARFVRTLAPLRLEPVEPASWIEPGAAVLITGGLGGLGLAVAAHLARHRKARLVLLGRSEASAAAMERVRALEDAGAEVLLVRADTGDEPSLRAALGRARTRFGRIDAVIHAAGMLHDSPMAARGDDPGRAVIEGKALGALLLDRLLAADPPRLLVLFSSVSAVLGLPGQADYTAANAYLDALAQARSGGRTRVVSVGWNAWQQVGLVAKALRADGASSGQPAAAPALSVPLSRASSWVVGEHVVKDGAAVLPGTFVLELFAQALGRPEGKTVELRDVVFLQPFVVPDAGEVRAQISVRGDELALFSGTAQEPNATARGGVRDAGDAPSHDLAALRTRCAALVPLRDGRLEQPFMDFGPRWGSLRRLAFGAGEALAEVELAEHFASDLSGHVLHPALLDLATGTAQALKPGVDPRRDFFVPFSYARILVRGSLPRRFFSHVRLQPDGSADEIVFDANLFDDVGRELVAIEGYRLRRVREGGLARRRGGRHAPAALIAAAREGILPDEGLDALDRVLASPGAPHVVASSVDVLAWKARLDQAAAPPVAGSLAVAAAEQGGAGSPRTEMERALAALWRELLGVENPGLGDNFFDLGGESLIAVRMSVRLRRQFGVELPLAALFETPTLEKCAALLDRARGVVADGTPAAGNVVPVVPAARPKRLVLIKPGQPGLPPFFCVHGAGGNVMNLRDVARGLQPKQPVYGLQARGVDGAERPHEDLVAMAAEYLGEIRQTQPEGPYLLGGYSGGGVVAYEMAQQLTAAGQRVGALVLFDTFSPLLERRRMTLGAALDRMRAEGLAGYLGGVYHRRREGRRFRRDEEALERVLATSEMVPPEIRETHLTRSFAAAMAGYHPRPWDGRAILFSALDVAWVFSGAGPTYGWDRLISALDVRRVAGNHATLLLEPQVGVVIAALNEEFARIQQGHLKRLG